MLSPFKFSLAAAFTPLYYFIFQHRTICICRWIERFLYRWEIWHCNLDSWMGRRQCCRLWEMPFYPMSWEYVDVFLECSIICSICFFFQSVFCSGLFNCTLFIYWWLHWSMGCLFPARLQIPKLRRSSPSFSFSLPKPPTSSSPDPLSSLHSSPLGPPCKPTGNGEYMPHICLFRCASIS